jgi:hypothetical protein
MFPVEMYFLYCREMFININYLKVNILSLSLSKINCNAHNFRYVLPYIWSGIAQSVNRFATCWTVRGSIPGVSEFFCTCPSHPVSYAMFTGSLSRGARRQRRDFDHPPPSSAEVKERVELYFYSPSGPSWPVPG